MTGEKAKSEIVRVEGDNAVYRLVEYDVHIPADLTYVIARPRFGNDGKIVKSGRGGLLASAYDILAREAGFKWTEPEIIDETESSVKVRVGARYTNQSGRVVEDFEVYEIDIRALYEHARANWKEERWNNETRSYEVTREAETEIEYDDDGNPVVKYKLPKDAEAKLYRDVYLHLKKTKLAKAITCAKRRIVQRAFGLKGVEITSPNWQQELKVKISRLLKIGEDSISETPDLYDPEIEPEVKSIPESLPKNDFPEPSEHKTPEPVSVENETAAQENNATATGGKYIVFAKGNTMPYISDFKSRRMAWNPGKKRWQKIFESREEAVSFMDGLYEIQSKKEKGKTVYDTGELEIDAESA